MQAQEIWQLFVPLFSDYLHNSGVIYRDVKVRSSRWYEVKHLKTTKHKHSWEMSFVNINLDF